MSPNGQFQLIHASQMYCHLMIPGNQPQQHVIWCNNKTFIRTMSQTWIVSALVTKKDCFGNRLAKVINIQSTTYMFNNQLKGDYMYLIW